MLLAIVFVAFGLRAVYVHQLSANPLFAHPEMDELYHDQWARNMVAGESFVDGPYFRAPLYPAFLALIYKIFGQSYMAPRMAQAVLGSLSCGLLFLVGWRVFGRAVAGVAGFLAAGYWTLIYFDGELLIPSLIIFLDLLLLLLLFHAARSPGKLLYAAVGIVLGLSAIARPNILLLAPVLAVCPLVLHRAMRKRSWAYSGMLTLGCVSIVAPIAVRNYVVGGDVVLISSQAGVNFYIGNNPKSDGHTAIVPGTPGGWWEGYYASIERAEQAAGRSLKPSEVSRYYFSQAADFITEQPTQFSQLFWKKLRLFWTRDEVSNNKGVYFWTEQFAPVMKYLPIGFGVVGPLGLLGLILCCRFRAERFYISGFVLLYMLSVVLFFCTARYRMPVIPLLILLAVFAVFEGVRALRGKQWIACGTGVAVLALAGLFVNLPVAGAPFRNDAFSFIRLGTAYIDTGDTEAAIQSFRSSLELEPEFRTASFNLAKLFHREGRIDEAIPEYRRALVARPKLSSETKEMVARIKINLARALKTRARSGEAVSRQK
ncbi:MAG: glycosyltransferase family 39 protein [Planctomycetes bacterium]|nr:glycosyltransferase family 39 protein [Planctomycetota bacterium]